MSDLRYKVVFLGEAGVGKTSLISCYTTKRLKEQYRPTVGVDLTITQLRILWKKILLHIIDTAGQERFRLISNNIYYGSNVVALVFDITRKDSFKAIDY